MHYLIFFGVDADVKKVSLARLLHYQGGLSLTIAKQTVDGLIAGKQYWLGHRTKKRLETLRHEASALGAQCSLLAGKTLSKIVSRQLLSEKTPYPQSTGRNSKKQDFELIEA